DRQHIARGATGVVMVDDNGHDDPPSRGNQCCVLLAKATSDSITGTSTSTPTTVAKAAPEPSPNRLMATATASSKKFEVPISAQVAATLNGIRHARAAP